MIELIVSTIDVRLRGGRIVRGGDLESFGLATRRRDRWVEELLAGLVRLGEVAYVARHLECRLALQSSAC